MKDRFLIGSFMPGREFVFRYKTPLPDTRSFDQDELRDRLEARTVRLRTRRAGYWIKVQTGYALTLLLLVGAFRIPISQDEGFEIRMAEQELVELEEIVQTKQVKTPPPPPRPPVPVEVPDDELIDDEVLDLDASLDLTAVLDVPPPPPPAPEEDDLDEEEIFIAVEVMPEIIGGLAALHDLVEYPPIARKAQLEGTVVVAVVVNTDGVPSDPKILRSAADPLDKAAVEAVMKLRFKPGMQRNRAVRTIVSIPVHFRLS